MIDLNKLNTRKDFVIELKKNIGLDGQKAQVVLALDYSGSMSQLYGNGSVQSLVERLMPIAMAFDDNQEIDFYLFENGSRKMKENITLSNLDGYIQNKIIGKYQMGGTSYSPVINDIVKEFGTAKAGWFSKSEPLAYPVYVIFITDGENGDRAQAEKAITEASKTGVFFQFVGIGASSFSFLEKLDTLSGRFIDNANFFKVRDLSTMSDDDLYKFLLFEFPMFITQARSKNLIK